jgi:ATP-dependent helicase HepA
MTLVRLVGAVQALRRRAEAPLGLSGALSVAAELWDHQVRNIAAVLTDLGVRHLIADEVGLGKTVQALAVIRAARLTQPEAQVVVVCPDELVRQWTQEALARAAFGFVEGGAGEEGRGPVLLWPKWLAEHPEAWAAVEGADLLVVDELPRLPKAERVRLLRALSAAPSALVLTGTLALGGEVEDQILAALEPLRAAADAPAWPRAVAAEEAACAALGDAGPEARQRAALRWCAGRRVLRSTRDTLRAGWPARRVKIVEVAPLRVEVERQRLLWAWMRVAQGTSREFELDRLAQRVRSPASLRQRITWLLGHGHDREGLLQQLSDGLSAGGPDSRQDALLDELAALWRAEPGAKVVIAANDNLTVDHLHALLPRVFDGSGPDGGPLQVARIRSQREGPEALVDPDDVVAAEVQAFSRGDAAVMLLTDRAVAGINLQAARHVVLYACSWEPREIDQLIGRVDRITGGARGDPPAVTVIALTQAGLVDARVVHVLRASGLLERPLSGSEADVQALTEAVAAAGLVDGERGWAAAERAAERVRRGGEGALSVLPLRGALEARWSSGAEPIWTAPAIQPTFGGPAGRGAAGREEALWAWMRALHAAKVYSVDRSAQRTWRVGYFAAPGGRPAMPPSPPALRVLEHPLAATRVWRRSERAAVDGALDREDAVLELLDHGSPLHEALLDAWGPAAPLTVPALRVYSRADGALRPLRGRTVAVACALALPPPHPRRGPAVGAGHLAAGLAADARWLAAACPGALLCEGVSAQRGALRPLTDPELAALLAPDPEADCQRWRSEALPRPPTGAPQLLTAARAALSARWAAWWGAHWPRLRARREERCWLLRGEVEDLERRLAAERAAGRTAAALRPLDRRLSELRAEVDARVAALEEAVPEGPPQVEIAVQAVVEVA